MRTDRSLISGLGAAASLVGAVACAFFVTAALVAFHRWPQVATTSAARALVVAGDSRRPPAIVVSPRPPRPASRARVAARATSAAAPRPFALVGPTPRRRRIAAGAAPLDPAGSTVEAPRPIRPSAPVSEQPVVAPLPTVLAGATQRTTTSVGGVVSGVTNGLAVTVTPVSPSLGGAVQRLGSGAGGAVVLLGRSLARLLLGLGPSQ